MAEEASIDLLQHRPVPRDHYLLIGRHRATGKLESHGAANSGDIMLVIYEGHYPEYEWHALYDAVEENLDARMIDGAAFEKLVADFTQDMDRQLDDDEQHRRLWSIPTDQLYGRRA